jgi:hypothetical protein
MGVTAKMEDERAKKSKKGVLLKIVIMLSVCY